MAYKNSPHYIGDIEPIDFIEANNLSFNEGNVVKYISRWKNKNGLDDLEKAKRYLDRIIDNVKEDGLHEGGMTGSVGERQEEKQEGGFDKDGIYYPGGHMVHGESNVIGRYSHESLAK